MDLNTSSGMFRFSVFLVFSCGIGTRVGVWGNLARECLPTTNPNLQSGLCGSSIIGTDPKEGTGGRFFRSAFDVFHFFLKRYERKDSPIPLCAP